MIYKIKNDEHALTIMLKGNLTFTDYGTFSQILDAIAKNKEKECIIDLDELDHIDSAGLGMLILCKERIENDNKQIVLKHAKGQVSKMLELGKFNEIFDIRFTKD
jgi:anti-anti-sigma factor